MSFLTETRTKNKTRLLSGVCVTQYFHKMGFRAASLKAHCFCDSDLSTTHRTISLTGESQGYRCTHTILSSSQKNRLIDVSTDCFYLQIKNEQDFTNHLSRQVENFPGKLWAIFSFSALWLLAWGLAALWYYLGGLLPFDPSLMACSPVFLAWRLLPCES
jgi:hypothetical protein